ncbi:MAG: acyl-CoA dehydrogenase [bacterium]|nr:acyl-CoA dehydrogenase [Deltaproteobacteria bacterium]MCP4908746.1 acyl-CoA dehydrogenase [bacterium]
MTTTTTPKDLIDRARALAHIFAEEAVASERLRRPTDEAIKAAEETEIFKLMVPRRYGGLEFDVDTFIEVVLVLSEGDASLAWVTAFLIEHNWMFSLFPESFQKSLFADRSYILAPGMVSPSGIARPVTGGNELSGRWPFATGISHSTWVIAGAILTNEDGAPDPRFFALPLEDVTVEDTWRVDGMCGTGSADIVIENCFVPEDRSVSMIEMNRGCTPGATIHDAPLYRTPMAPLLTATAAMPSLGQARALVREYAKRLPERNRMGMDSSMAESTTAQIRLARLSIAAQQTELLFRDTMREVCALRERSQPKDRTRLQAQIATVVHQSREIVSDVCAASGAGAHQLSDRFQRARRDAEVMACHMAFDIDTNLENAGKAMLGLELSPML